MAICYEPDTTMLDDYPIDDDYIDVEEEQAETSRSDEMRFDGSHTFDRSDAGTTGTARDVEIDAQTVSERDDRGQTRTGFNPSEASHGILSKSVTRDGRERKYSEWLMLIQNGYRDKNRYIENNQEARRKFVETATAYLSMTKYQKRRVQLITDSVDLSHMGPYPMEVVVMAVISVVANEDNRWIREEEEFKELVSDLDGSMTDVKNSRLLVKDKSSLF